MDKTRIPTNSKICPDSTCAISVMRKGQILLVFGILVLSATYLEKNKLLTTTQFGYGKKVSTTDSLLYCTEKIRYDLNKKHR